MTKVHILKPGCNPDIVKEGKTNLQLRELQMLRSALQELCISADILTTADLCNDYMQMSGHQFIIFNSAKYFDDDLNSMLSIIALIPSAKLLLISNDCRLKFDTDKVQVWNKLIDRSINKHDISITLLTNATVFLDDYAKLVCPKLGELIPVMHLPVDMLPCWLKHSSKTSKTGNFVYTCMHFADYDYERKQTLKLLAEHYNDDLTFTGDMEGLIVNGQQVQSIVTDTKDVYQWYAPAKVALVILEKQYAKYGVMPNRLSEALMNNCCPAVLAYDDAAYLYNAWRTVANDMQDYTTMLDKLVSDDDYRASIVKLQTSVLKARKRLLLNRLNMLLS